MTKRPRKGQEPMEAVAERAIPQAALRIDGPRRINLKGIRERREAKRAAPRPAIEDTRVADAWAREERRGVAAVKAEQEADAIAADAKRARQTVRSAEAENPWFQREHKESVTNPAIIKVAINIAESAIETLYARSAIDRAQKRAADKFRGLWEAMGGKGAGAIDYGRERVDGGKIPEPITHRQIDAGKELQHIRGRLVQAHGEYSYRLVTYICGQGHNIHDLTETRRQRDTMTDNLRMYLDLMAEEWGFRKRAKR